MENKINIAELLKDCPQGMELDCTMYDNLYFDLVDNYYNDTINCYTLIDGIRTSITFTKYGTYNNHTGAKCVIFPKGKTTWEGFVPFCQFKDGDIVATSSGLWIGITTGGESNSFIPTYCVIKHNGEFEAYLDKKQTWQFHRLATEEEKQKLFDAIKANGYKWNPKTKTLEKLPKFKVGDRIILKDNPHNIPSIRIKAVTRRQYMLENERFIYIDSTDKKYVLEDRFNITTLKPFDKVLVRDHNAQEWVASLFSNYNEPKKYKYICVNGSGYAQCIPYEENKHLLGTTNDCDEYYKTWE